MNQIEKAILSLDGLSVGDAFGAALGEGSTSALAQINISNRKMPSFPWQWTDDTHMALSIVENLAEFETIEQDELAERFAERFSEEPYRGYGAGAIQLLQKLSDGENWRDVAPQLFQGGSYGNGAAMRAAPIGAYYQNHPKRAALEAQKSAVITHTHTDGQAGAIAVAVAASIIHNYSAASFLNEVIQFVPDSSTRDGIILATKIPKEAFDTAVSRLGTGWQVSAQDTVPFCLWVAAHYLGDFEEALWVTAQGGGDRDTTCAIVGGIIALSVGKVPTNWIKLREDLSEDFLV